MNIHLGKEIQRVSNVSRRTILQGGAGFALGIYVARGNAAKAQSATGMRSGTNIKPNTFLIITPDNLVTVMSKHIEMGQGPLTGMATLVAEELDADWSQMRGNHAPSNPTLYKNLQFGVQGTGGSSAIANSYEQMRKVGAARERCSSRRLRKNGMCRHPKSPSRRASSSIDPASRAVSASLRRRRWQSTCRPLQS